jgi:hypothetical protein
VTVPPADRRLAADEDRAEITRLHAQGLGRNDIMRATGLSARRVSGLAAELGLSFNRGPQLAEATETRRQDLASRRLALAEQLLTDAENLRARMWQPTIVYAFGGKDNTFEERTLDEAPAADKKNLMATAGMAIDRSLKLCPPAEENGIDNARSMLGKLMTGLTAVWNEQQEAASDEGAGDAP